MKPLSPWRSPRLPLVYGCGALGVVAAVTGNLGLAVVLWLLAIAFYHLPI